MITQRSGLRIVGSLLLVVVGVITIRTFAAGPDVHADGAGPLGSLGGPGSESMSVDPSSGSVSWTYGLRLCLAHGTATPILQTVAAKATLGTGFRTLGTKVRTFTPTRTVTPIISVDGYPPPTDKVPDSGSDVPGFAVATPCSNRPEEPYTELLVGLGRAGSDGGGWKGIKIEYLVDGRTRTLELDHDLLICGDANPVC